MSMSERGKEKEREGPELLLFGGIISESRRMLCMCMRLQAICVCLCVCRGGRGMRI